MVRGRSLVDTPVVRSMRAAMFDLTPPTREGTVAVRDRRELGFAEFGKADARRAVLWFHGTPGARRQIPEDARVLAEQHDFRIIGMDRPGIGRSTPHLYPSIVDVVPDVLVLLNHLQVDQFTVIGLSGGGPYALATAHALPDRVTAAGILGGVAPHVGDESIGGGLVGFLAPIRAALPWVRTPLSWLFRGIVVCASPIGHQGLLAYSHISPEGDREVLAREEIEAMFLDDLMTNGRRGMEAPLDDLILFLRPWGFSLKNITVPVQCWHGDADHIVPFAHGEHLVSLIPGAKLHVRPRESHLGGLGAAEEVLHTLLEL
jgi:pimeloyl-ACP methyl ester carboxylesterase